MNKIDTKNPMLQITISYFIYSYLQTPLLQTRVSDFVHNLPCTYALPALKSPLSLLCSPNPIKPSSISSHITMIHMAKGQKNVFNIYRHAGVRVDSIQRARL